MRRGGEGSAASVVEGFVDAVLDARARAVADLYNAVVEATPRSTGAAQRSVRVGYGRLPFQKGREGRSPRPPKLSAEAVRPRLKLGEPAIIGSTFWRFRFIEDGSDKNRPHHPFRLAAERARAGGADVREGD